MSEQWISVTSEEGTRFLAPRDALCEVLAETVMPDGQEVVVTLKTPTGEKVSLIGQRVEV